MAISRRGFLVQSALAGGTLAAAPALWAAPHKARPGAASPPIDAEIVWLDGAAPTLHEGLTWGVPWPRGTKKARARFGLRDAGGGALPMQSWTTATWPDGSIKWTAHAIPAGAGGNAPLIVGPGRPAASAAPVSAAVQGDAIVVRNGAVTWRIGTRGAQIIRSALHGTRETLRNVRLVATAQDRPESEAAESVTRSRFESAIETAAIEQDGPVRAVIRVEGRHRGANRVDSTGGTPTASGAAAERRAWLPFSLRLYFHAGSESVRIVHSFIFDGDEQKDFLCGLGLTGDVPMADLPYDRHIRFAGSGDGIWAEAVQPLTGLRRNPGKDFTEAQVAGRKVPPVAEMAAPVREGLPYVPHWSDFTLAQANADGFTIAKRTKEGHGWIDADTGGRANGLGFVGGPAGGAAFGMGDFWQRPPVRLDIRDAATETAAFTLWYHAPDAVMDLRFYHDGMGMTDHVAENEGLDITYEDYERGWGTPHGIARTTEFTLWALAETPTRERFAAMAHFVARPPRLVPTPARLHAAGVFGDWSLPDRTTPAKSAIEEQNDFLLRFYREQVEQRRWYGFWNYGDVMHTYDADRHVWRYDIGGYAWDNSELSPDLWLWYSFLRSGDARVFRMAEAMTRHTGEVDVYHLGRFRGLGTRHAVQHWGDSSKQPRVSNAAYRRIYYYLTADERTGDLMRELLDGDRTLVHVDIGRKVNARRPGSAPPGGTGAVTADAPLPAGQIFLQFGTSWSTLVGAWLTEWERTGAKTWRDRIVAGMTSLAALPKQWFAGGARFDLASGRFIGPGDAVSVSHLNSVFGAVEINAELFDLLDVPAYEKAWLDYCVAYNAPPERFAALTGAKDRGGRNLKEGHSRLTAFAARHLGDPVLARRAWDEFFSGDAGLGLGVAARARRVDGPAVLKPVDEAPGVSTNATAQWGLAAIQNLALVGDVVEAAWSDRATNRKR
ncbi:twin-arginine translocation signal domain-containing protein [Sphingosinicella sp. BN140058]|uniref:exo-rhamnogalacturonan lyase family protein n=1 Tax=Sphingosinicella sp. BN140058 TaxID=1892855 RepID=UPI00101021A9|nr:twin-arginine translocation signal domain-containing protein [Sphingosinicella sp. BN140058]QAY76275.1 twin-arginine translocation signal domain-containing protein [Sphingosinicella sp. BN140058]